jgi:hypothetical protein
MLQATYSNSSYTFWISLKDKQNNSKTNQGLGAYSKYLTDSSYGYLWKFTNDMSGEIQWSYGVKSIWKDRFFSFNFYNDGTKNVYTGKLQLIPKGYYKYEVYECLNNNGCSASYGSCDGFSATQGDCPNPLLVDDCKWEVKQGVTVIQDGTGDNLNKEITGLAANTYDIITYQDAGITYAGTWDFIISSKTCGVDPDRFLLFTKVNQQKEFMSVTISSTAPSGHYVVISSDTYYFKHTITSNPETFTIDLPAYTTFRPAVGGDFTSDASSYDVYLYNTSDVLVDTYNNINAMSSDMPCSADLGIQILAINNAYDSTSCSQAVTTGSIFMATTTADASGDAAIYSMGSRELSKITEGKLYVDAAAGNKQVEYKEHPEPSGTNYIWYGQ